MNEGKLNKVKNVVIYDGDCGFCQRTVNLIQKLDWLHKFDFIAFQGKGVLEKYSKLTREMCEKEIFLVKPNGRYYGGYNAFKIITIFMPLTFLFSWFFFLPGITHLGKIVYRLVAENRHRIKLGDMACKVNSNVGKNKIK